MFLGVFVRLSVYMSVCVHNYSKTDEDIFMTFFNVSRT